VKNSGSATPIKLANTSFISNMGTNSIARICPGLPATSLFETKTSRDADLPIRKSAGDEALAIWGRDERGEDEESS
jgi:hypothetical protein